MSRDITEYSKAAQALRESEAKFEQLYTNAPTPYHTLAPDGTITNVNKQWCRTLEYDRGEVVGRPIFDFVVQEEREAARQSFAKKKKDNVGGHVSGRQERHYLTKAGEVRAFKINDFFYLDDEQNVASIHTTMEDKTEGKKQEQELRDVNVELSKALEKLKHTQQQVLQHARMSAVGQMASGIAHDFNNALMPILGFSELLVKNPDMLDNRDDTLGMLKDIHDAAMHATHVIRRLREFYRPQGGTGRQDVNLSALVQGVLGLTRSKWHEEMKARDATVRIDTDLENISEIHVNESQLREVITNLILNAVDALPDGGTITIAARQTHDWTVLEVSDNGVGMSKETLEHCYEPFYSTKGTHGTGLGLSVAYGIISQHGGHLKASSTVGEGTTVALSLPRAAPKRKKHKKPETVIRKISSLRILVADDEEWSRHLIKEILSINNHSVELAECGAEAIEKFRNSDFDLLITDRAMPDMSGDTVAAAIKEIDPATPVILLTGFGDLMKDTGECPPGVDKIVSKPVSAKDLQAVIAKLVVQMNVSSGKS
jgi:PAS domain S-box-containing protein